MTQADPNFCAGATVSRPDSLLQGGTQASYWIPLCVPQGDISRPHADPDCGIEESDSQPDNLSQGDAGRTQGTRIPSDYFPCNLDCDWIGGSIQALLLHKNKNHLELKCNASHSCKKFFKRAELEAHLAQWVSANKCTDCDKGFRGKWATQSLRRHVRVAHGARNKNETTCGKKATKFTCDLDCDWTGHSRRGLLKHKNIKHLTFKCTASHSCGKFFKPCDMEAHLAQYLDANKCKYCDQEFIGGLAPFSLRRHERNMHRECTNKTT